MSESCQEIKFFGFYSYYTFQEHCTFRLLIFFSGIRENFDKIEELLKVLGAVISNQETAQLRFLSGVRTRKNDASNSTNSNFITIIGD